MNNKKILITLFAFFISQSTYPGIMDFLNKHDNKITASAAGIISGIATAYFFPTTNMSRKLMDTTNKLMNHSSNARNPFDLGPGISVVIASKIVAGGLTGILTYKLIKKLFGA